MLSPSALPSRLAPIDAIRRCDTVAFCLVAILNLAALVIMAATEVDLVAKAAFLLAWTFLNFFWLALFRRPIAAALVSIEIVVWGQNITAMIPTATAIETPAWIAR